MAELASLGIEVETRGSEKAVDQMQKLTGAARQVETATGKLSGAMKMASATMEGGSAGASQMASSIVKLGSSEDRLAVSVGKGTAALKAQTVAANQNTAAFRSLQGQTGNVAAQINDIGVQLAGGQSPFLIALQQGTQLNQIFGGAGLRGTLGALGAAFASVLSPVSLLTIGIITAGGALLQYFTSSETGADKANEAWKSHSELIKSLKDSFGVAAEGLTDYVIRSQTELAAAARAGLETLKAAAVEARTDFVDSFLPNGSLWGRAAIDQQFMPFKAALEDFRDSARAGRPDFAGLRMDVERLVAVNPQGLRAAGDAIINASTAAADAERRVKSAEQAIALIGGTASGQVSGVSALTKALNELASIAVPALSDAEQATAIYRRAMASAQGLEDRNAARAAYDAALTRLSNTAEGAASELGVSSIPLPGRRPLRELSALPKVGGGGGKSAGEKYSDIVDRANQRITALKAEQSALGMTEQSAAALRYETDLMAQAQQRDIALTPERVAQLRGLAAEMAQVETATKGAKEMQQAWSEAGRGAGELLSGLIDGTLSWKDALKQAIPMVLKLLNTMNTAQGGAGIFGGGVFQSIIGGILGVGFKDGGYTGGGAANVAAGEAGKELSISKKSKPLPAANQNFRPFVPQKVSA